MVLTHVHNLTDSPFVYEIYIKRHLNVQTGRPPYKICGSNVHTSKAGEVIGIIVVVLALSRKDLRSVIE